MCSYCSSILRDLAAKHDPLSCPLRQGDYCSVCGVYGHTTVDCGQTATIAFRSPQTFEQILHPNLLELYGLSNSNTPLPGAISPLSPPKDPRMMVPLRKDKKDTDRGVRAILGAHNIPPGSMKTNIEKLEKLCQHLGKRLIWIPTE